MATFTIGTAWQAPYGTRRIVGENGDHWLVCTDGDTTAYFEPKGTIERIRAVDESWAATKARNAAAEAEAARKQADAEAEFARSDLGRFLATLTPMAAGKAKQTLTGACTNNGTLTTRANLIERRFAEGWRIDAEGDLTAPDGLRCIPATAITKTGAKYGRWLAERM